MNRNQLISSLVILALLGLSIFFVLRKDSSTWNSSRYSASGEILLADFDVNRITSFTVSSGKLTTTLKKNEDGSWSVSEKDSYPGEYRKIISFLQSLPEIKTVQNINAGKSQLEKLGLGDADKDKGTAILVDFSDEAGKKLLSLLIGKVHFKKEENPNPYFGGATPDARYVMVCDGKFQPKLVNYTFDEFSPSPMAWTDKSLVEIENIKAIEVSRKNPADNWKIIKDAGGDAFKLSDLKDGEEIDPAKTSPFSSLFKNVPFQDVWTCPADFAGETATIETAEGFKYEIRYSPGEDKDKYLVNIRTAATIPEQREAVKDEKPEDKDRLDKEFKAKSDKLKEKLEKEKSIAKWIYTVSKKELDSVLKSRNDFLKAKEEKKDEKKPAAEPAKGK